MSSLSPSEKAALRKNVGVQFGTDRLYAAPGAMRKRSKAPLIVGVLVVAIVIVGGLLVALSAAG